MDITRETLKLDDEGQFGAATSLSNRHRLRLRTVGQMLNMSEYAWATNSYLRHVIFAAEDRVGSGGATVLGNGLAPAIVRIGRKVLIDLDEFDRWVEGHRMDGGKVPVRDVVSTTHVTGD